MNVFNSHVKTYMTFIEIFYLYESQLLMKLPSSHVMHVAFLKRKKLTAHENMEFICEEAHIM